MRHLGNARNRLTGDTNCGGYGAIGLTGAQACKNLITLSRGQLGRCIRGMTRANILASSGCRLGIRPRG